MQTVDWHNVRINEVIVGGESDVNNFQHVRSGFRVIGIVENGLTVQRIHAHYLNQERHESWVLRWDQLENQRLQLLPENSQLPLL